MTDLLERLSGALGGRYRVEAEIGRGGMAVVYLAYDRKHERRVAIKVLRPELTASIASDRFLREIRIAAQLQHPHILALYDSGEAEGLLYYVMPYADGETLRQRLDREKQLRLEDVLRIAANVADALAHAHSYGVVHRDVKPENILLIGDHALVADFGVARALSSAGVEFTDSGVAVGTPAYMSPEQAAGASDVDARSDIYSLACVVFEMLGGEPPFTGVTPRSVLARQISERPPSIRVLRPTVPPAMEDALGQALAKVAADRPPTAMQFLEALTRGARAPGRVTARLWSRTLGRRQRLLLAATGALAAASILFVRLSVGGTDVGPQPETLGVAVLPAGPDRGGTEAASLILQGLAAFPFLSVVDGSVVLPDSAGWQAGGIHAVARQAFERGVRFLVAPEIVHQPDGAFLSADLIDGVTGNRLVRKVGSPSAGSWGTAAGRIALELGAEIARLERLSLGALPELALATTSPMAYAAVREGQRLLWIGDYHGAVAALERAIAVDPSYPLAYLRLSVARTWEWNYEAALEAVREHDGPWGRGGAHARARELAEAQRFYARRMADSAIAGFQRTVRDQPENVDGWFGLGESIYHFAGFAGLSPRDARHALERVASLDSAFAPIYSHLVQIALYERDEAAARRYLGLMHPDVRAHPAFTAALALTFAAPPVRDSTLRALVDADRYTLSELFSHFIHGGENAALADTLGGLLDRGGRSPDDRARGRAYQLVARSAAGNWIDALHAWDGSRAAEFDRWLIEAELAGWPVGGRTAVMWSLAEREVAAGRLPDFTRPMEDDGREMFRALVHRAVRQGSASETRTLLTRVEAAARPHITDPLPVALERSLRARLALLDGDTIQAKEHLTAALQSVPYPYLFAMPQLAMGVERALLARLALAEGDSALARRWVRSFWTSWSLGDALYHSVLRADARALGLSEVARR